MQRRTRPVRLAAASVVIERGGDGSVRLRSRHALGAYPPKLTERLEHWARVAPDRTLFAQRSGPGWKTLSYGEALARARRIAAGLLARGLSTERPLAVLSGNDIE